MSAASATAGSLRADTRTSDDHGARTQLNDIRSGDAAHVRAATAADLAGVEALLRDSELPLAGVREALSGFVVAEQGGSIVGVAGLEVHGGHALLRSVAVAPGWRSRGLGRQLVERMIAEASARGLDSVHLLTTTADRYFPTFGFTTVSRDDVPPSLRETEEFTTACPASATVMRLFCGKGNAATTPATASGG